MGLSLTAAYPPPGLPSLPPCPWLLACTPQGQKEIKYFLHNHLRFTILYNRDPLTDLSRIVGFEVEPFSVAHEYDKPWDAKNPVLTTCNPQRMISVSHSQQPLQVEKGNEVVFTYDVVFSVRSGA